MLLFLLFSFRLFMAWHLLFEERKRLKSVGLVVVEESISSGSIMSKVPEADSKIVVVILFDILLRVLRK